VLRQLGRARSLPSLYCLSLIEIDVD
jgi:hypothetical protein